MTTTYEERVKGQIDQYEDVGALWKLPPIYRYWNQKYINPRFRQVFGQNSIFDAYLEAVASAARRQPEQTAVLHSIGAGDCQIELQLAAKLKKANVSNVRLVCLELSPVRLERAKASAEKEGVVDLLEFRETDLNAWYPGEKVDVFIAHHALHHMVSLEGIYDAMVSSMTTDSVFVTADIIGRNGHRRWPETLHWIERMWKIMPERYKHNFQFNRFHETYLDWDCSSSGFEGIRAEEVLPLINERFDFDAFLGFGGLIDPWIERGYGQSLDPENPQDTAFVDLLEDLNQTLIECGKIKPTMMLAAFRLPGCGARKTFRGLTPSLAVRDPQERAAAQGEDKG